MRVEFCTANGSLYECSDAYAHDNPLGRWRCRQRVSGGASATARATTEWRALARQPMVNTGERCVLVWDPATTPPLPETLEAAGRLGFDPNDTGRATETSVVLWAAWYP